MTESTQLQTTENNNTGVVKMDPPPVSPSPSEQQYALKWNDFQSSILSSFRHLRDEEDFVDVTLACDQRSFTAHKVVLSACSPYFRKLLKANPCEHPIVILRDVRAEDVESLLRFMYNGEVNVGHEQLSDFLKTAQLLQVRGLADVTGPSAKSTSGSTVNTTLSSSTPAVQELKASPTSTSLPWELSDDRSNHLTPPPQKRIKSADLYRAQHGISPERLLLDRELPIGQHPLHRERDRNRDRDHSRETSRDRDRSLELRDSLLGQALESGQQLPATQKHPDLASLQAQSTGEDSNSSDTEPSDRGDNQLDGTMDSMNGSVENQRSHSFPSAFLGLQGIPGLLPGPSGIHGADNFDGQNEFGLISVKKEFSTSDPSSPSAPSMHQCQSPRIYMDATTTSTTAKLQACSPPVTSPTVSTASYNGSIGSPTTKVNSTNPTAGLLRHQQEHEQHQLLHHHRQQQQQQQQQHHHQQQPLHLKMEEDKPRNLTQHQLDELQTHQQLRANLFMARTIALSSTRDLQADMMQTAPSSGNYLLPCPLCETPLEPRLFRQHLDRHYPRESPVCPVMQCGRRFAHPNSVRNHMRIKHTIQWAKMKAMRSSGGPFTGIPDYK